MLRNKVRMDEYYINMVNKHLRQKVEPIFVDKTLEVFSSISAASTYLIITTINCVDTNQHI